MAAHIAGLTINGGRTVCAYAPVGAEPGSIEMLDVLLRQADRVLLPVTRTSGDGSAMALLWGEYQPGQLVTARFGLLEPAGPVTGADWPTRASCLFRRWPSTAPGPDWAEAAVSTTGRWCCGIRRRA